MGGQAACDQDRRQSAAAQDQHGRRPRRQVRPLGQFEGSRRNLRLRAVRQRRGDGQRRRPSRSSPSLRIAWSSRSPAATPSSSRSSRCCGCASAPCSLSVRRRVRGSGRSEMTRTRYTSAAVAQNPASSQCSGLSSTTKRPLNTSTTNQPIAIATVDCRCKSARLCVGSSWNATSITRYSIVIFQRRVNCDFQAIFVDRAIRILAELPLQLRVADQIGNEVQEHGSLPPVGWLGISRNAAGVPRNHGTPGPTRRSPGPGPRDHRPACLRAGCSRR